jgi:hypothetical protein
MARMRKEAREAATSRAAPMSPGAVRRQRRRELYHARRVAQVGVQDPTMIQNAPPTMAQENPAMVNAGASATEEGVQSVLQTVQVMGAGRALGSQESCQVCLPFPMQSTRMHFLEF